MLQEPLRSIPPPPLPIPLPLSLAPAAPVRLALRPLAARTRAARQPERWESRGKSAVLAQLDANHHTIHPPIHQTIHFTSPTHHLHYHYQKARCKPSHHPSTCPQNHSFYITTIRPHRTLSSPSITPRNSTTQITHLPSPAPGI